MTLQMLIEDLTYESQGDSQAVLFKLEAGREYEICRGNESIVRLGDEIGVASKSDQAIFSVDDTRIGISPQDSDWAYYNGNVARCIFDGTVPESVVQEKVINPECSQQASKRSIYLFDDTISEHHGLISYDGNQVMYRDLNSTNGTFVSLDGKVEDATHIQNQSVELKTQSMIILGSKREFRFKFGSPKVKPDEKSTPADYFRQLTGFDPSLELLANSKLPEE